MCNWKALLFKTICTLSKFDFWFQESTLSTLSTVCKVLCTASIFKAEVLCVLFNTFETLSTVCTTKFVVHCSISKVIKCTIQAMYLVYYSSTVLSTMSKISTVCTIHAIQKWLVCKRCTVLCVMFKQSTWHFYCKHELALPSPRWCT